MPFLRENRELVRRFRAGDRDALRQVYEAYVDKIAGIVRFGFRRPGGGGSVPGVGWNSAEAVDVIQEVFAKSFSENARLGYDGVRDYGPYLYAIARNVIADRSRQTRRELPTSWQELERLQDADIVVDDQQHPWADDATVAVVRAYVAGLDEFLGRVHRERYVDGRSQRDAAERLGISRQSLRTFEVRLRDGLRRALGSLIAIE